MPSRPRRQLGLWVCAALTCVACDHDTSPPPPTDALTSGKLAKGRTPLDSLSLPGAGENAFEGELCEVLAAGSYSYLRVSTARGDQWVTTMGQQGLRPGDRVSVRSFGSQRDFSSKRLRRRFAQLHFGVVQPLHLAHAAERTQP